MMKKPSVISALGLAACVAFAAVTLFPSNGGPTVHAAMIMERLNEQIEENPLLEITLDSLNIENQVKVDGFLQVAEQGIAGSIEVSVQDSGLEAPIEVDLSLGLTDEGGWVLLRKLIVPEPDAQPIIDMLFPPGSETMLLLPADTLDDSDFGDFDDVFGQFGSEEVIGVLQELIASHSEYGATVVDQPDGTVLLTLKIEDAESIAGLAQLLKRLEPSADSEHPAADPDGDDEEEFDLDDVDELIGATLTVVYDPDAEQVRSFSIEDLGPIEGRISIAIRGGEIDPALLDAEQVKTPNTRVFDLSAFEALAKQMNLELD
ncbi:MAG: hypothetical protein JSU63_11750 [Phycisphaerales bacterium]|nr:MAG: hypothetical protein JSU63_11750 [Phycisphaerales bacterium]